MYCLCYAVYIVNALTRARWFSDSAAAINFIQLTPGVTSRLYSLLALTRKKIIFNNNKIKNINKSKGCCLKIGAHAQTLAGCCQNIGTWKSLVGGGGGAAPQPACLVCLFGGGEQKFSPLLILSPCTRSKLKVSSPLAVAFDQFFQS